MISKNMTTGEWALAVFDNFRIDKMLPKHEKVRKASKQDNLLNAVSSDEEDWGAIRPQNNMTEWPSGNQNSLGWKHKIMRLVVRGLGLPVPSSSMSPSGKVDPLRVLLEAKTSLSDVSDCLNRMEVYDEAIREATAGGQTARAERLTLARKTVRQESVLRAGGFTKFLSETQAVEFATKCQRGLRLDWAANFVRPFPKDALARKALADGLLVFDNYVVMHYDPKGKAFTLTAAQEAAKRDPILFGVIEGVRKLYFVADWADDECDLTMGEVAKVLGHDSSEIGDDPTKEP